jgi:HprK-related kinase A
MLTVGALSQAQLRARLAGPGVWLHTGAFVVRVRSALAQVAEGIGLLYADYPLCPEQGFAHFHVNFQRVAGLRGWVRPQVRFDHDGHAPFESLPAAQAFALFEWGMNWCVSSYAHRYLMIHSAVVEKNGRAAILPAPSGSGKSTLCAALVSKGWRLLSDELALLRLDTGELAPLPRPISLKNNSIGLISDYAPGAVFGHLVRDTVKGTVAHMKAPAESVRRAAETAPPAWIVFPRYQAGAAPLLAPVPPAQAFLRAAENAFNYSLLGADGFRAVARLVDATRTFDFSYGALDDAVAAFDQLACAQP